MKRQKYCSLLYAWIVFFCACVPVALAEPALDVTTLYKARDIDAAWSVQSARSIDLNALNGETYTISGKGDYLLSGDWNGQIIIDAPKDEKVRLILNGVSIRSPQGPAIYEKQSDKLIVTLAENTVNTLADGPALTDGDMLGVFAPEQAFDTVIVSSDQLESGSECTVLCGEKQLFSGAFANNLSGSGTNGFGNRTADFGWGTKNTKRKR